MRTRHRGFTILELLVAAGITALIASVSVGLMTNSLTHWNRVQGRLTTVAQARVALDRLQQDLQGAWYRDDGQVWLVATVQTEASASGVWVNGTKPAAVSLRHAMPDLADARFGLAGVWLRFFTSAQGMDSRSHDAAAPVAVSYQVIRRAPTPSSPACSYRLYRAEVTPSATFGAGYDLDAPGYTAGSEVDGAAGNVTRPGIRHVLADNVIDFGVRFYASAPDPATGEPRLLTIFPWDEADLEHRVLSPASASDVRHRFPPMADVMLRVLTAEGARQIAALEAGHISGEWWAIAEANSQVFIRRIRLKADPT